MSQSEHDHRKLISLRQSFTTIDYSTSDIDLGEAGNQSRQRLHKGLRSIRDTPISNSLIIHEQISE